VEAAVAVLVVQAALFFFFQAEDGIRDFHVTGVQTCALPISHALVSDICRGLLEAGRALCGAPVGANRLDYLLCRIASQQPDWIEPLKRRMSWLENEDA